MWSDPLAWWIFTFLTHLSEGSRVLHSNPITHKAESPPFRLALLDPSPTVDWSKTEPESCLSLFLEMLVGTEGSGSDWAGLPMKEIENLTAGGAGRSLLLPLASLLILQVEKELRT